MNIKSYMNWPCKITQEDDCITISVFTNGSSKELEDITTCGNTVEEACSMAVDAIIDVAECFWDAKKVFPIAREIKSDERVMSIPLHVALKIALRNIMISERYRAVDIYTKVEEGTSQKFNQDIKLRKPTRFEKLAQYFAVVNHPLDINF